ncbi:MAG: hypothetical protein H3C35_08490 [Bacteroidetes bacterium]|nr:hypothetical protein [Bacteroidota bacterium]
MAKKKLTLLEQALAREKELQVEKLAKVSRGVKNNFDLLKVLLPNYIPQEKQSLFHKSNADEKGVKGGYGSGKTIALCAEAIALAYLNRPILVVISSPTEDLIEDTTYATLKMLCDENNIAFQYTSTNGLFKIFFGEVSGNIRLIGGRYYKGPNIAALGLDEPFSQRRDIVNNLIARVRSKKAKRLETFWSGTAEPELMEWGTEFFEKDSDTKKLFTITIPTRENKHLPNGYIERLQSKYDAKTQEVYLEGKFILRSANPAYHSFDRKKNVAQTISDINFSTDEIVLGFDFNVDPMSCAVFVLRNKVFYQIKDFALNNSNTKELCVAVIAYLKNCFPAIAQQKKSIIISGDASGRRRGTRGYFSDYEIIRDEFAKEELQFYFNIPTENPAVRDRVNFVNKLFESERFVIDENCTKSIRDRELVSWKSAGEGFILDKSKKDLTHLSDAADYALWNCQQLLSANNEDSSVSVSRREKRH